MCHKCEKPATSHYCSEHDSHRKWPKSKGAYTEIRYVVQSKDIGREDARWCDRGIWMELDTARLSIATYISNYGRADIEWRILNLVKIFEVVPD